MFNSATKLEELLDRIENIRKHREKSWGVTLSFKTTTTITPMQLNKAPNGHTTMKTSTKWSKGCKSTTSPRVQRSPKSYKQNSSYEFVRKVMKEAREKQITPA